MADREKGKDRTKLGTGGGGSGGGSGSGPMSFLPAIFGALGSRKAAPAVTSRVSTSGGTQRTSLDRATDRRGSLVEEILSPRPSHLPLPESERGRASISPAPFDLQGALAVLQPDAHESEQVLSQMVKATAVYLANLLVIQQDIFTAPKQEAESLSPTPEQITFLYRRAIDFANPNSSISLRVAALRLLAALFATSPPATIRSEAPDIDGHVYVGYLYKVVTASPTPPSSSPDIELMFVTIGALKALTKNGDHVDYTPGIVGWLLKSFNSFTNEWIQTCSGSVEESGDWSHRTKAIPFAPIRPATVAETASACIDLLHAITAAHNATFSPSDITRIVQPMLDMVWLGIGAASKHEIFDLSMSLMSTRIASPVATSLDSPAIGSSSHGLGLDTQHRASRPRKDTVSSAGTSFMTPYKSGRHTSGAGSISSPYSPVSAGLRSPSLLDSTPQLVWQQVFISLCSFLGTVVRDTSIQEDVFERIIALLCLALGQDDSCALSDQAWDDTQALLAAMLARHEGKLAQRSLKRLLEGQVPTISNNRSVKVVDEDRLIARGAVIATRRLLHWLEGPRSSSHSVSLGSMTPFILAAESTTRFPADKQSDRERWLPVDLEILVLVRDYATVVPATETEQRNVPTQQFMTFFEGQAACDIVGGLLPVVSELKDHDGQLLGSRLLQEDDDTPYLAAIFIDTINVLSNTIGRLPEPQREGKYLIHPAFIDFYLQLAGSLNEARVNIVIDYFNEHALCAPFYEKWTENIWKLFDSFYFPSSSSPTIKQRLVEYVFQDIYDKADMLSSTRIKLVDDFIFPFCDRVLVEESNEAIVKLALDTLARAAVAEVKEKEEHYRKVAVTGPSGRSNEDDPAPEFGNRSEDIRRLLIKLCIQSTCKDERSVATVASASSTPVAPQPESTKLARNSSLKGPSNLRGLMGSLSPPSRGAELPPISAALSASTSQSSTDGYTTPQPVASPAPTPVPSNHLGCKSLIAIEVLISMFCQLAFVAPMRKYPPHAEKSPSTVTAIGIFRDFLSLLYPMTTDYPDSSTAAQSKVPARCPRARLVILQFLMRLRADNRHRIYVRPNTDRDVYAFAETIHRTAEQEQEVRNAPLGDEARKARAAPTGRAGVDDERGRAARSTESSTRSRSRSKAPIVKSQDVNQVYTPLWRVPDNSGVTIPVTQRSSIIVMTYDPEHPLLQGENPLTTLGIWLPVSEYVRTLNGILRGHDWELVSYVLCFLPLQLRSKMFFHGVRATKEVRALLDVLCEGVTNTKTPWEKRFNIPTFITRIKINAVAYQSLAILISYRGIFSRDQCDRMIQSFIAGLQGRREVAKPCLQALTLCVYELEQYVSRHLLEIVERMKMILSTTAIAVHVLEFLISLGQNGNIFRNFTDDNYRLIFAVAIGYIGEHNARSDLPTTDKEEYTLSQHVIGLAYYAIYIWFMAMKLPQRPGHVSEITRNLLSARSQRLIIDEMAEVCFDWLARYTYGNADPRPSSSFLSEAVMSDTREAQPPKSQSWLLGGAIITITTHARTGWATIRTMRPTGSTSIVCRLENVPMLDVGEASADLVSLPALLLSEGKVDAPGDTETSQARQTEVEALLEGRKAMAPSDIAQSSQHGFIWSGATPSQRRKDVVIDPSYIALQLLSSYPNTSLATPRGRILPNEERFNRALRGIDNTSVIDTLKIGVLYVGPGQSNERDILGNIDGSPLYLDFISGLGRLIRLKGQKDVFVGGLNRENDSDGEYAYAWWDDLSQMVFHTATMMPNIENNPEHTGKKRLIGNDFVKIIFNDTGKDFQFDTIRTAFNLINIVIAPHTPGDLSAMFSVVGDQPSDAMDDVDKEDYFSVVLQCADGIPDFSPIGAGKIVSRRALPIFVRHIAHLANDLAARFTHIRDAADMASAEYITSWRHRLRAMGRLRSMLPAVEVPDDPIAKEELLRDFSRSFTVRAPDTKE